MDKRSLVSYSPWFHKELEKTNIFTFKLWKTWETALVTDFFPKNNKALHL